MWGRNPIASKYRSVQPTVATHPETKKVEIGDLAIPFKKLVRLESNVCYSTVSTNVAYRPAFVQVSNYALVEMKMDNRVLILFNICI